MRLVARVVQRSVVGHDGCPLHCGAIDNAMDTLGVTPFSMN
ncbi:hypothetical protein K788_0005793 [Paraburkholderia caribensis MBA4]|uniref:Uncharacterized protein n=1 Tax=Paraburkholderia caribensis MBA4 TaxID=1323664 RepID=A0A0P0RDS5_9BURK|nr:hypothetical protein K788_0005793 [Paraburkholderia caribensis MBA4]